MAKKRRSDSEEFDEFEGVDDADEAQDDSFADDADEADADAVEATSPDSEQVAVAPPARPRAKTSILNLVLIVLNWVAAGAFAYLLLMDFRVRQDYAYANFQNLLEVYGLPLREEEDLSVWREGRPRQRLDSATLAAAATSRGVRGKFVPVEEKITLPIRPSLMTPEAQKDHFGGLASPSATLEDEIASLKTRVPDAIAKAGDAVAAATAGLENKRKLTAQVLLPLAYVTKDVQRLDKKVREADGTQIDSLLSEAVQRRLYFDLLAPLQMFRPGNPQKFQLEKIANWETTGLDELKELLRLRLDACVASKRDPEVYFGKHFEEAMPRGGQSAGAVDSVEKRRLTAMMMVSLAELKVPPNNEPLFADGLQRAQKVVGLAELTIALDNYAPLLRARLQQALAKLEDDRLGQVYTKGGTSSRTQSFAGTYNAEIERLKTVAGSLQEAEARLAETKKQAERVTMLKEQREQQVAEVMKKVAAAREETSKYLGLVREKQREIFEAQRILADADVKNFQLEAEIQELEKKLRGAQP